MLRRIVFLAFGMALMTSAAFASATRDETRILDKVAKAVNDYVHYTIFDDINAGVDGGVVTLTGKVTMPYKREDIMKRVAKIDGVREVRSQIEVLPVSIFDDELRLQIATAIYGNEAFWHYAHRANPPIHIVVEHGHVTLTGVVNNNVERMVVRDLATRWGAFTVTNNLRTDAEAAAEIDRIG